MHGLINWHIKSYRKYMYPYLHLATHKNLVDSVCGELVTVNL